MLNITKTFLPKKSEYFNYLNRIWDTAWVTNNGTFLKELEGKLTALLDVPYLQVLSSGTISLQIAMRVLEVSGEVITTPFSYVATTSSILWGNCTPVYVDIEPGGFNINAEKIEEAITDKTSAILATHVFGLPCDLEKIREIADRHNLKLIYDAAHAFGVSVNGKSLLSHGDLSATSFHATKVFHTVEGGALIAPNKDIAEKIFLTKAFGHKGDEHIRLGINGKNSEFHAAMGLSVLPYFDELVAKRKKVWELYVDALRSIDVDLMSLPDRIDYNYGYFPVLFRSHLQMIDTKKALEARDIYPRRYFYPSLDELSYHRHQMSCPRSSDVASRILCLPIHHEVTEAHVEQISKIIRNRIPIR